jgi:hypothetical protein
LESGADLRKHPAALVDTKLFFRSFIHSLQVKLGDIGPGDGHKWWKILAFCGGPHIMLPN